MLKDVNLQMQYQTKHLGIDFYNPQLVIEQQDFA